MKQRMLIICCLLAVLSSCAHPRKAEFEAIAHESRELYDAGQYRRALDTFRALHRRFPEDDEVTNNYRALVEKIKKQADRAYEKEDYADSYRIYSLMPAYCDDLSKSPKRLSFSKSFLRERIKSSHIKLSESSSGQHIASGHFQKAFDICAELGRTYRKDDQSQKCMVTAVSQTGEAADALYRKTEYADAARVYLIIRKNIRTFKAAGIAQAADMRQTLDTKLSSCSIHLNRKGLELYRKGELNRALAVWKEILEFDPDNAEVIRSIRIASDQIENMK